MTELPLKFGQGPVIRKKKPGRNKVESIFSLSVGKQSYGQLCLQYWCIKSAHFLKN